MLTTGAALVRDGGQAGLGLALLPSGPLSGAATINHEDRRHGARRSVGCPNRRSRQVRHGDEHLALMLRLEVLKARHTGPS